MSAARKHLGNALKIVLTFALLAWLMASGKLNFRELLIFGAQPGLFATLVAVWLSMVAIGTLRWKLLLEGAGYVIAPLRAVYLQLTGLFFNSAMPGAVSGDLVKVLYIIKDNPHKGKSPAMMSIVLDRIIGLIGMFLIGFLVMLADWREVMATPALMPSFLMTLAFLGGAVVLFACVLMPYADPRRDPIARFLSLPLPLFKNLRNVYDAFRLYHGRSRYLFYGLGLSVVVQGIFFLYFCRLTVLIADPNADFMRLATIFPVGMLTTAIPLAPGGLGVGHVAFDRLFALIGMKGGANVFNAYALGQLALNLLGCIPYLMLKRTAPLPQAPMLELQNEKML